MFFIVNNTDRPDQRHVCQTVNTKTKSLEYLHIELRGWGTLKPGDQTTHIMDFGFNVEIDKNGMAHFKKITESKAKYSDGTNRRWQGEEEFKLMTKRQA